MSECNPNTDANKIEPKTFQNEDELNVNKSPSIENYETLAILPNIKPVICNEVIVDIEDVSNEDAKNDGNEVIPKDVKVDTNIANKDHLVYAYYGQQIRPPKTTWVMFQAAPLPPDATPLEYDPSSRNGFVRLVFIIVLVMLINTAIFVGFVLFTDVRDIFIQYGIILVIPAMILMVGLNYAIACSPCVRIFPCNIICLFLAVLGMSVICAYITSRYRTEIVFFALLSTCVVVFICFLLAFSSFDFTAWFIYIVVIAAAFGAVALVAFMAMMITGVYMQMLHLGILIVGTVLNVVILTMELQMVLGGGAVEIGEDDYALGAFLIYTSIVDIFLKLVQILGMFDE